MKQGFPRPLDPLPLLERWFAGNRRDLPWRRRHDLYGIWVSEVMLQQTRVETVVPYYRNFLMRFPSLGKLADASLQEVLKAWEGLGYYSRARNLHRAARQVRKQYRGRIPVEYGEFRKLPGVGEYIAAAVLSLGRDLAIPVVDGNVLRVVSRWQGIAGDIRLTATRRQVRSFLERIIPAVLPGRFNEALMELGALVCLPQVPLCRQCPLRPGCFAFRHDQIVSLPVTSRKKPVPTYRVALGVITEKPGQKDGGRVFIQQRPEDGHLGGLWEFPGGKCRTDENPEHAVVRECREELGVDVEPLAELAVVRHAYSHFKILLHVFVCRLGQGRIRTLRPHAWVKVSDLDRYPFPAANHKFFPLLKEFLDKNSV